MKAIIYREYGSPDVLRYEDIEKPAPGAGEVLVRVRMSSVNPIDWHLMRGLPYFLRLITGPRRPKSSKLGVDVAGEVERVGSGVTLFKAGDAVFGGCFSAFAEYVSVRESNLVLKPDNVTFAQAGCVAVAALTALQGLRDKGQIRPGQKVVINGAAGGVGTFAVQIAKSFGAEVTGICSTRNVDMVRSIGADVVIDYTREDFTSGTQRYDIIFDCIGNHSLTAVRRILNRNGRHVAVGGPTSAWMIGAIAHTFAAAALSRLTRRKFLPILGKLRKEDLALIGELMASGKIKPVIDRRYSLRETPEAVRYLEEGHARGKVIITV